MGSTSPHNSRISRASRFAAVLVALTIAFLGTIVLAQPRGSNRILVLEEEIVEGRIEKPEAFYILQPTNLNYEHVELQQSFIPELLDTVRESPFKPSPRH